MGLRSQAGRGLFRFLAHLLSVMTPGDRILFSLLLGMGALSILGVRLLVPPGLTASVLVANRLVSRWSLATGGNYTVTGSIGPVQLGIHNQSIRVLDSRCVEKICIRQGAISRRGEIIVCVPNRMVVAIDGREKNAFDAVTP